MPQVEFVHLHNHTEYSLLDGALRITDDKGEAGELIRLTEEYKMPAVAITDHGNMSGAIEFYQACIDRGIKPVIGCEIYITEGSMYEKKKDVINSRQDTNYHLVLLAQDNTGYENLMEIVSAAYLEGFYRKPRVDKEFLSKHNKGIICLSGCLKGELAQKIISGDINGTREIIYKYRSIFGNENYYIELMDNGIPDQKKFIKEILPVAQDLNVNIVATNDCHYLHREDAYSHDILLCIDTGVTVDKPNRLKFSTQEFYFKSPQEMASIFKEIPYALKNTIEIANRCSININFNQILLPHFKVENGKEPHEHLKKLCEEGLKKRYKNITEELKKRLQHELDVIKNMGFSSYFLIVHDIVNFAKKSGIPVGPGRGSGAGSLVSYCLGITNICPIKYGLLFERFLNIERKTMPDLDIDFADFGREKIIEYVKNKYGYKNVAQIITFGTMQAKLAIRDVARVLGFSVSEGDKIAKLIPENNSIFQALKNSKELKEIYESDEKYKTLIDTARKIEGLKRHTSVHAAGIVIASDRITKYTPLAKSAHGNEEIITTQYNDESLIKLGMLKIDILGLRTLSVIENTLKLISGNKKIDLDNIPLDDKKTFNLLQEAKTVGVFQIESSGMRDLLRKLKPTTIEDIIALISLYRPGPIRSGMLDEFVKRKHQPGKIKYDHPLLEPILKETYGIIVYQEQVMRIATELAGFTSSQADSLRKAMSKKIPEVIVKERSNFVESAKKRKIDTKTAEKIFDQIVNFGEYGFNKSHAAAYGMLAYQTAYFKANYPVEYMCALISSEIGKSSISKEEGNKLLNYINEAKAMGIKILPPDVQKSDIYFTIENNNIRFGLLAIKNVGEQAAENIISVRRKYGQFKSIFDFCSKIDPRHVNRKAVESLIKAGAFDFTGEKNNLFLPSYIRAKAYSDLELIYNIKDRTNHLQETLFEIENIKNEKEELIPWPDHVVLSFEKEVIGMYFSGHPLAQYKEIINSISTYKIGTSITENTKITVAGMVSSIIRRTTKDKGEQWAKFKLENFDGEIDVLVFPKVYKENVIKILNLQSVVVIKGKISANENRTEIIAEEIILLDKYIENNLNAAEKIYLKFSSVGIDDMFIDRMKKILTSYKGKTRVYMKISSKNNRQVLIETPFSIHVDTKFLTEISKVIGENSWEIPQK